VVSYLRGGRGVPDKRVPRPPGTLHKGKTLETCVEPVENQIEILEEYSVCY
jgi:hypothetical protein